MPRAKNDVTTPLNGRGDKYAKLGIGEERGKLTWGSADANLLRAAVAAVTEDGAALLLTKTSDGGALCLQVWAGTNRHKLYPVTALELTEALQVVIETASS